MPHVGSLSKMNRPLILFQCTGVVSHVNLPSQQAKSDAAPALTAVGEAGKKRKGRFAIGSIARSGQWIVYSRNCQVGIDIERSIPSRQWPVSVGNATELWSFAVRRTAWTMKNRFRPLKRGRWWEGQTFEGSAKKLPTTHHLNQELHGKTNSKWLVWNVSFKFGFKACFKVKWNKPREKNFKIDISRCLLLV